MKFIVVFLLAFIFNQVYSDILLADNTTVKKLELKSNKFDPRNPNYRLYFWIPGKHPISPIHDINLYATKDYTEEIFNVVVEIPFGSKDKKEMATCEPFNPIFQDSMRDNENQIIEPISPRTAKNTYPFNYGALPQTWENSIIAKNDIVGDNDPLDIVEIGRDKKYEAGSIIRVKVLGVIGLVDSNDSDWKVIAIDVNDKFAKDVRGMQDVVNHMVLGPRFTEVLNWFDGYKDVHYISSKDGTTKSLSELVNNREEKYFEASYALDLIEETHKHWIYLSIGVYTRQQFIAARKKPVAVDRVLFMTVPYYRSTPEAAKTFIQSGVKVVPVAKKTWKGRLASLLGLRRK